MTMIKADSNMENHGKNRMMLIFCWESAVRPGNAWHLTKWPSHQSLIGGSCLPLLGSFN